MVLEEVRGTTCGIDVKREVVECDGMDAVRLLAAATKLFQPRGIRAEREVEAQGLIAMMRVAFDLDELEKDEVFWLMKRWERRNPRYPLLRQWRTLDPLGVVLDQRYWQADLSFMVRFLQAGEQLAVFKMDLDNFGAVNRSLGHSAGDEAIRLYCSIVKNVLGSVGEVYRRGGDEVVALVPGLNETRALTLAEEIRSTVEARFRAWCLERGLGSHPTTSIGLVFTEAGRSCEEIVREMDEAQQRAKQEGKNRVARLP
jgi:diguanylate cyclase (GGDEF)-like protein